MIFEKCLAELDYNCVNMSQCGVYVISCKPTGRRYVGASVNVVKRIREHFYRLEKGVHHNLSLQYDYRKYGEPRFSSKVVLYCDPSNLEMYGKQVIEKLQPEYNIVNTENAKGAIDRSYRNVMQGIKGVSRILRLIEKL